MVATVHKEHTELLAKASVASSGADRAHLASSASEVNVMIRELSKAMCSKLDPGWKLKMETEKQRVGGHDLACCDV